jgi:hypothetical protein
MLPSVFMADSFVRNWIFLPVQIEIRELGIRNLESNRLSRVPLSLNLFSFLKGE